MFDTAYHLIDWADERTLNPPHLLLMLSAVLFHLGLLVFLYDLAMGSALADDVDRRRLARAGLLLASIWPAGALVYVFPFSPEMFSAHTDTALIALTVGTAMAVALRLWPWPFPALSILVSYIFFRSAVYGFVVNAGYSGVPRPLEPPLVAGLAVDLWLLLPFNRGRGVVTVALAGLIFGFVWAPLGYAYLLPLSSLTQPTSLQKAVLESIPAALLGAMLGVLLAHVVTWLTHLEPRGRRSVAQAPEAPDPRPVGAGQSTGR